MFAILERTTGICKSSADYSQWIENRTEPQIIVEESSGILSDPVEEQLQWSSKHSEHRLPHYFPIDTKGGIFQESSP